MYLPNLYHKKMQMQTKQYYMHSIVRLWINYVCNILLNVAEDSDTEDDRSKRNRNKRKIVID